MAIPKTTRIQLLFLFGLCALRLSDIAQAQDNPPPKNVPPAPVPRVYDGINETPWYNNSLVREHLKLSDEQVERMNQVHNQYWERYHEQVNKLAPDLTPIERWKQMHQLHNGYYNNFNQNTEDVLTDAAVRNRYNQLQWQYRGYGAFNDPLLQEKLNLTEQQRRDLGQANREWNQKMSKWKEDYATDQERVIKQFNSGRGDYTERLKSVLTPAQQRSWEAVTGTPYQIPAEAYFQTETTRSAAKPVLK